MKGRGREKVVYNARCFTFHGARLGGAGTCVSGCFVRTTGKREKPVNTERRSGRGSGESKRVARVRCVASSRCGTGIGGKSRQVSSRANFGGARTTKTDRGGRSTDVSVFPTRTRREMKEKTEIHCGKTRPGERRGGGSQARAERAAGKNIAES